MRKRTYKIALILMCICLKLQAQDFEIVGNTYGVPMLQSSSCNLADTCFTLTENTGYQKGAVWNHQTIDLSNSFDASFCMYLGNQDSGADGFAFVLRNDQSNNIGNAGEGLGYGNSNGLTDGIFPSVAIEFDTYFNSGLLTDIAVDHTTLVLNGNMNEPEVAPIVLSAVSDDVEDDNFHVARLVWDASLKKMEMYFDGVIRFSYTNDIVANVFGGNPEVIWGFTASTGGSTNLQQICFPSLSIEIPDQTICEGDTAVFHYYHEGIAEYQWTNSEGMVLIDWNNAMGTPLIDTSFTATQSDIFYLHVMFNNNTYEDSAILNVVQYPILPLNSVLMQYCPKDSLLMLDAKNEGANYEWQPGGEQTQMIQPEGEGWYRVIITEPMNGCVVEDSVQISFMCEGDLLIGNVFTPNKDGINDFFEPIHADMAWLSDLEFEVVNRWGGIVYKTTTSIKWDGTDLSQQALPSGVYFYRLSYKISPEAVETLNKQGFIHLLRD